MMEEEKKNINLALSEDPQQVFQSKILKKVRIALAVKNMTAKKLCEDAGVSPSIFSEWRTGRKALSIGKATALLKALGFKLEIKIVNTNPSSEEELSDENIL
jgi:transcriptional regulator with XRE-family HTH domain